MTVANYLALALAGVVLAAIAVSRVHGGADRALTRIAIAAFGDYVAAYREEHPDRQAALRAAHVSRTYREYGARTYIYAGAFGAVGAVAGTYLVWGLLSVLSIDSATLAAHLPERLAFLASLGGVPALSTANLVALLGCSSLTLGVASAGGTYWLRWWYPSYRAGERARRIEAALPSTVAFVYALSRSGMEFPKVMRIVAANDDVYGAAAEEFEVAVRHVDTFGTDVVTALQTMGRRTASPQFREFTENLVSVLQSGHSLSTFLERQYHDYREEAESQQEGTLDVLETLAESYVTVLVAGPLFLITILVVIGFSLGDTLDPLRALVYVILPLGNLAFVVYLSTVTDSIDPTRAVGRTPDGDPTGSALAAAPDLPARRVAGDGGVSRPHPNEERLRVHRRLRGIRRRLRDPLGAIRDRPAWILLVTVPLAAGAILWDLSRAPETGAASLVAVDDTIALAALFVLTTFAVVYERHRRRIDAIEAAVPDLLDRLASVNEAGMSVVASVEYVRRSDLGALDDELDRVWTDVEWGADLATALQRMGGRVRTRATARVVTLLTEAMAASGTLATVLRIAARQAAADRRLQRERKRTMLEYTVVVYISFLVFLFIIAVLWAYLLPNLPTEALGTGETADAIESSGLGGVGEVDVDAYETLFYHATLLQALLSGFIAGQLSTGDVRAGAKHAAAMLAVAVLVFGVVL